MAAPKRILLSAWFALWAAPVFAQVKGLAPIELRVAAPQVAPIFQAGPVAQRLSALALLQPVAGALPMPAALAAAKNAGKAEAAGLMATGRQAASRPSAAAGRVAQALREAGAADVSGAPSIESLNSAFDGLAAPARGQALTALESAVKAAPADVELRRAFQDLIVRDELSAAEPKLRGPPAGEARRGEVLSKTSFDDIRWWHYLAAADHHPEAEGRADAKDLSIHLHVKSGWRKLRSLADHFRVLFTHEYTHRLQFEGGVTTKYGGEIPAVSAELLRAIELVGLPALERGAIAFVTENVLGSFANGRQWTAEKDPTGFYFKGFLAGVAYRIAEQTGRWEDAWRYHRRVSAGEEPSAVESSLLGQ